MTLIAPVQGKITQYFNDPCCRASYQRFGMVGHNGIDYGIAVGTPIVAAMSGKVYEGFESGGYGNFIFITDSAGNQTVYGHLSGFAVSNGQTVTAGQKIGLSGNTGNSTGPHLHFGYRPVGYNKSNGFLGYVDPLPLIGEANMATISDAEYEDLKKWKAIAQLLTDERDKTLYPFVTGVTGALGIPNKGDLQPALDAIAKLKSSALNKSSVIDYINQHLG